MHCQKVTLISVEVGEDSMVPYYDVRLQNDLTASFTKEYITNVDEKRLFYIPITAEQLQE